MITDRLWPFFTFFGGKWRVARTYPEPRYPIIIEPFAGSAGYSLNYHRKNVLLVDIDPALAYVWEFLITASCDDIHKLPILTDCQDVRDLGLTLGAQGLIGFWLNKGSAAPRNVPSKWMRSGLRPNSYWGPVIRDRISGQIDAINHWKAYCMDYREIPNIEATWFIDPPYSGSGGRNYRYSNRDLDYAELAEWCKARRGQVIVCEQDGANWLPFVAHKEIKALEGKRGSNRSLEVVWTNSEEALNGSD